MKKFTLFLAFVSLQLLIMAGTAFTQELPNITKSTIHAKGNNSADVNDVSGMPEVRKVTAQETEIKDEIIRIRREGNKKDLPRLLQLENQLEKLNPNSVSKLGEYYGGSISAVTENPLFSPNDIGHSQIFNTNGKLISGIATAVEQRGTTAGRIWAVAFYRTDGFADSLKAAFSDDDGATWLMYAIGNLSGTDRINFDDMDMEIIEPSTGDKFLWIVYGFRETGGTGRWRTGGLILKTPNFAGAFYALSWPGDDASKRYYGLRITSDNAAFQSASYVYMVASFDSVNTSGIHINTQKTLRCIAPYTTSPTFSYKADKFFWYSAIDEYVRTLHSDIAYFFRDGQDSLIVSFSNVPDSTKLFFAKSDVYNGTASSDNAGGPVGGLQPEDYKQFARLSSNSNDNGSIISVFRQKTGATWKIKYFRTTNYGDFNSVYESILLGSAVSDSYQPDIVGVRNASKHYFAWRINGSSIDSLRYIGVLSNGNWPQDVAMMNSQTSLSGVQGPKAGFRYVNDDSCFVIYSPFGPKDVWAAYGCPTPTDVSNEEILPAEYLLSQNYPNPFNPSTQISFQIPTAGFTTLNVYGLLGNKIISLINKDLQAGNYDVNFDASNLPSGIYFYRLNSGSFVQTKKMLLLK